MPTVLITGANRGIGLEFARQYTADGWNVLACARDIEHVPELKAFRHSHPDNLSIEKLDVLSAEDLEALRAKIGDSPIDVLIHNAGFMPQECVNLGEIDYQAWYDTLAVNTIAPVMLSEALLENVAASEQKKIVAISTGMASITNLTDDGGGHYQYRTSKAALNMAMATMARDVKDRGVTVLLFSPGWVRTRMGGPGAPVSPEQSVTGMRGIIDQVTLEYSGYWYNFDGAPILW